MDTYHVEWSHTSEECHRLLEETKDKGSYVFNKFYWDCESDPHVGWGFIEAGSEEELRRLLPASMHSRMKFRKVRRISDLATDTGRNWDMELDRDRGLDRDLDRDKRDDKEGFEIHNREDFRPKKSA